MSRSLLQLKTNSVATALLSHALKYQRFGFCVIPVHGKEPTVRWKQYQRRRPTESDLRQFFAGDNASGLGVICGDVSGGLVVRDFDTEDSYLTWQLSHQELAEVLPTVRTARGFHVYFANCHRKITTFDDGELRGAGYVLVPPSLNTCGSQYEWINPLPDGPLLEIDPFEVGLGERYRARGASRANGVEEEYNLDCACSVSLEEAISKTLPRCPGERNRRLFSLCRALKSIPSLVEADVMALQPYVSEWYRRGKPFMSGEHDEDDNFAEFCYAWHRVKFSAGTNGPFAIVLKRLESTPLPDVAERFPSLHTRRLIHFCRELQRVTGDVAFFLSCHDAGGIIGLGDMAAWRRLGLLVNCGIIKVVQKGTTRKATRYRYLLSDAATQTGGTSDG